jgi:DNA primase
MPAKKSRKRSHYDCVFRHGQATAAPVCGRTAVMNRWLNFREIKQTIPIEAVLRHYQWKCLRRRGDRAQGCCPIHRGQRADAFHADLRNNGFHCFSCQAHGGVLDLVVAMERCSLRQAALLLTEWFGVDTQARRLESAGDRKTTAQLIREKERLAAPLQFTLRPLDSGHAYLRERGIDTLTAAHFGVGYYAAPGLLHGRVVIPIHNEHGQLLAYAGRSINGASPKYKLPAGFAKSRVLFNLHRAMAHSQKTVIVVEGFFDCMKVHQAGLPCVVALMGCCLSEHQETRLVQSFRNVELMLDADSAGVHGRALIADRLSKYCGIEIVCLAAGQQPDRLSTEEIHRALSLPGHIRLKVF